SASIRRLRLNAPPMSAHPDPRATRSIRAETAGSSALALGPNQRGKAGGEVEASIPVMAMAHQRTRRRVRLASPSLSTCVVSPPLDIPLRLEKRRLLSAPLQGCPAWLNSSRSLIEWILLLVAILALGSAAWLWAARSRPFTVPA